MHKQTLVALSPSICISFQDTAKGGAQRRAAFTHVTTVTKHPRSADVTGATARLPFIAFSYVFLCCTILTPLSSQYYRRFGLKFIFFNYSSRRSKNLFTFPLVKDLTHVAEIISMCRFRKLFSHFSLLTHSSHSKCLLYCCEMLRCCYL